METLLSASLKFAYFLMAVTAIMLIVGWLLRTKRILLRATEVYDELVSGKIHLHYSRISERAIIYSECNTLIIASNGDVLFDQNDIIMRSVFNKFLCPKCEDMRRKFQSYARYWMAENCLSGMSGFTK